MNTLKFTDRKKISALTFLCSLVYFTSYMTRQNFGAVISEIVISEGILKSTASLVTTAGFISYGAGQLVSGYLGDKIDPKKIVLLGLLFSSAMNLCIPLCPNVKYMTLVWLFNGFAQSMMWPPIVKILSSTLNETDYRKSTVNVCVGGSSGTIAIYLLAPLCIWLSGWKSVFICTAVLGLVTSAVWAKQSPKFRENKIESDITLPEVAESGLTSKDNFPLMKAAAKSGMVFIVAAIFLQGILRDGIATWIPSLVTENFRIDNSLSILLSAMLPISSVLSVKFASFVKGRFFENEITCATVMFGAGFISALIMLITYRLGAPFAILMSAMITGLMHGVNLMLVCMVPRKFERYGRVSLVSGMLNFFTYVGSAFSTYFLAKFSENFGWTATIASWVAIAFLGGALCLMCIKRWNEFNSIADK